MLISPLFFRFFAFLTVVARVRLWLKSMTIQILETEAEKPSACQDVDWAHHVGRSWRSFAHWLPVASVQVHPLRGRAISCHILGIYWWWQRKVARMGWTCLCIWDHISLVNWKHESLNISWYTLDTQDVESVASFFHSRPWYPWCLPWCLYFSWGCVDVCGHEIVCRGPGLLHVNAGCLEMGHRFQFGYGDACWAVPAVYVATGRWHSVTDRVDQNAVSLCAILCLTLTSCYLWLPWLHHFCPNSWCKRYRNIGFHYGFHHAICYWNGPRNSCDTVRWISCKASAAVVWPWHRWPLPMTSLGWRDWRCWRHCCYCSGRHKLM